MFPGGLVFCGFRIGNRELLSAIPGNIFRSSENLLALGGVE